MNMITLISEELMIESIILSNKWNNTAFIVINESGTLDSTIWNHWKFEEPQRDIIASVNGNEGFKLHHDDYQFQTDPSLFI